MTDDADDDVKRAADLADRLDYLDRHWAPRPGDDRLIRAHLDRQVGVRAGFVKLDTGVVVADGSDAVGEDR